MVHLSIISAYSLIKLFHTFVSATFLLIAIWLFIRSIHGLIKEIPYKRLDKYLSFGFVVGLYLQFIFGLILFSNLLSGMGYSYISADNTTKMVSKRLWPVEHIVLMIFALVIANLGLIISLKTKSDQGKRKNILIYYSFALCLILFSLFAIYFL
ncbi:MAG: hypothetical protein WCL06_09190 [Bacteroidota bacterium]